VRHAALLERRRSEPACESARVPVTVSDPKVIDIVTHDRATDRVTLVMVEERSWGSEGQLLLDLQEKRNTYLVYAIDGQLTQDYPALKGKPIEIQLWSAEPPGMREREFIEIAIARYLQPVGIAWRERLLPPREERR
jgi:hypothetical protein